MNHTTIAAIVAVAITLIGGVNHLPGLAIAQITKLPLGSQGPIGSTLSNAQDTPLSMHASSSGDSDIGGHPSGGGPSGDNGGGGIGGHHGGGGPSGNNGGGGPSGDNGGGG